MNTIRGHFNIHLHLDENLIILIMFIYHANQSLSFYAIIMPIGDIYSEFKSIFDIHNLHLIQFTSKSITVIK